MVSRYPLLKVHLHQGIVNILNKDGQLTRQKGKIISLSSHIIHHLVIGPFPIQGPVQPDITAGPPEFPGSKPIFSGQYWGCLGIE